VKLSQQIPAINVLNETTKPAVTPAPVVMTPEQLQKLSEIKTRAGWLSPSEVTSLAKGNATTEAIDAVATMKAKQIIDDQGSDQPEGNWARRNVYDKLKATTRYTFAGLNFVPEFVQGGIAQFFDDNKDVDGWMISTTLGSLLANPELQGEGFFPGDKLMEKQAERARRYRGTVNGSAWTVGRGAANLVFKPKSLPYNIMSGVLDAAVMIRFDPVLPATKAAKILTAGPNKVPRLSVAALKALREELATGVGLTKGLAEYGLDGTSYDTFSRTNRRFVTLIDRLVGEKSASRIAEDIFDHKLPNEVVNALAGAKDPEVVRAILATGWGISDQALPQDIRNIQKTLFGSRTIMGTAIGDIVHERMPLVDGIRKSRYFTTMAKGTIIVAGDTNDNRKAVKTIISYLRTAGVDADTVDEIASMAVKNFVPSGSDAVRKATMEVFEGTLKSVMKQDGIKDEVINELFTRARSGVEKARIYLQDRAGNATDNGYHTWLMNQDRGLIPEQQLELMLSELGYRGTNELAITSPTELVEMLDRVQVLPDLRDVRRITRSKLFRDVLGKQDKVGKRAITAKKVRQDITFVTDQKEFDRLGKELDSLMLKPQKTKNMLDQISELKKQRNDLKIVRNVKVVTAEEKGALNAIDYVQNQLWKPLALASGGYVVRNSLDAQIRMAFSELPSLLTHPMQYISLVTGTSKKMSLKFENLAALGTKANQKTISKLGQQINELNAITVRTTKQQARLAKLVAKQDEMLLTNEGLLDEALQDLAQELGFGLDKQGLGALDIEDNMIKTGHFSNVSRGSAEGATRHTDAVSQNGYRTFGDPLRRMAAQTFAEFGGVSQTSRDAAASRIVNLIRSNPELQDNVFAMHRKGFQITESAFGRTTTTGAIDLAALPEDEMVQALYQYAQRISVENAQTLTGGVYEIQFMYAFNRVPKTIGKTTVPTFETGLKTIKDADGKEISVLKTLVNTEDGKLRVGSIVEISTDEVGVVTGFKNSVSREIIIDPYTGGVIESGVSQKADIAIIQPIENADAFGKGNGTVFARRIIENTPIWDGKRGLPQTLKRELSQFEVKDKGELNAFQKTMDGSTDWFFGRVVGTITRKLERSPVFREYYYQEVNALVDRLDPAEAQKFLTQVTEYATEAGMTPEKYVGDKQIIARMRASSKTAGDVTINELDEFAKVQAVGKMKELLYDASERSNLQDALRIIMPFAPAWKEIIGTYAGFFKSNPIGAARSFQRIYTGIGNADPDNDGRGFFYKDPTTGQQMFTFPGSGTLAKALTGLDATIEAPVNRLSQGIQAFPALGPMAQIAVSTWMPDVPETDAMVGILLPYGRKGPEALLPLGYLQKLKSAWTSDEDDVTSIYFNTYAETLRALSATGDYDLSSKDGVLQLEKDAKFKARILTTFRAVSQFTGPTSGTIEFKVPTNEGDQFISALIKEFYDMQADPAIGYDKAVPQFLAKYGDEVALYVSSKSRAAVEGLEATSEFNDWERRNGDLISLYPEVSRYLAPAGSDFNFTVYDRQTRAGERVKLTDDQIIELAQVRIGSANFRAARQQVGPYPSDEAKDLLKRYRAFLSKKYPGFPAVAEFQVGKYYNDILELKQLVFDKRVTVDGTVTAIRQYLLAREQAIAASGVSESGFRSAKSAEPLRDKLASIGLVLSESEPNFARIYDRLLASEVE
jgi:hypothetical protein